tara:strand:- start:365 stop:490 length:126 start_codon:yes stop_codon:yes gene_type:complete
LLLVLLVVLEVLTQVDLVPEDLLEELVDCHILMVIGLFHSE